MNFPHTIRKAIATCLAFCLPLQPLTVGAEDIDIFVGASAGSADRPNVLIVLDNTSNWARQSQQWPGGLQQGQAEVRSIKTVLSSLSSDINIGVMKYVTQGNANDDGGYVRYHIKEMNTTNKTALSAQMDMIFGDINGTIEKRNSGTPYGNLYYDVVNYFSGGNSYSPGGVPSTRADPDGYTTPYTRFKSPLSSTNSCAKNYVIFISNPGQSGPTADSAANKTALAGLSCDTSTIGLPNFTMATTTTSSNLGNTSSCYSSQATCNAALLAAFPSCNDGTYESCSCGATPVAALPSCASGTLRYSVFGSDPAGTTNLGYTASCESNANNCDMSSYAALCTGAGVSCACNASNYQLPNTCSPASKKKYMVVRTKTNTTSTNLGYTSACYASQGACATTDYAAQCANFPGGCSCDVPTTASTSCPSGTGQYQVTGLSSTITATPDGTYNATKGAPWHLDEWSKCLYQKGVPVSGGDPQTAATYTIDVYNKQQSADHTALLMSTASVGGGKYFAATNEDALVNALKKIFQEILSVNSTFASASLPVNATNRSQNENQVFIGMFRPDPGAKPRWFGNLKRYQFVFAADGVTVQLGDKDGRNAINNQTGFVDACATSWWTTDSPNNPADLTQGYYWANYAVSPNPASKCPTVPASMVYSDLPDGPTVEKGAVAEVLRKGNNPSVTNAAPTWAVNRNFYTTASNTSIALMTGASTAPALTPTQKNWLAGQDTENEDLDLSLTETRGSIHGDVVHSRPLPINYGNQVVIFYGANDGNFRAVNADTGQELWTLVPNEFAQPAFVDRLRLNEPLVNYPSVDITITPTPRKKDYAWDGSVGVLQNEDNSKVWIYPTLRRGGKRIYALDVTNPAVPSIKWIVGCDNDGTNCSSGFDGIGQTWSTPNIAPVAGYATELAAFFGGGYDSCEDVDTVSPPCGSAKGKKVFAVDAGSGSLLKALDTDRSVPADVALLDISGDGKADYGYVADTGGNIYRIDMVTRGVSVSGAVTYSARAPADWTIRKIAATAAGGRKFLFAPALLPVASAGKVYLAIGSGDRERPLEVNYPYAGVTNRFYVYMDDLEVTSGGAADLDALQDKTTDLGCASSAVTPSSTPTGWYINLNQYGQGEQTVTSAIIAGGLIAFSTNRPIPAVAGTCASPLGEARGYWVNLTNASGAIGVDGVCGGARSGKFQGGGLPPSPVIGIVPINGRPTPVIIGAVQRSGAVSTAISPQEVKPAITPIRKRVYWKQKGVD
ncbi:MAG: PilC/PilY family type IV pilus protein [Rhodocyclaceae bacterium]|nr:PilC/PilY family type IV pilus protein [Rhodocyclaceae bacterium]